MGSFQGVQFCFSFRGHSHTTLNTTTHIYECFFYSFRLTAIAQISNVNSLTDFRLVDVRNIVVELRGSLKEEGSFVYCGQQACMRKDFIIEGGKGPVKEVSGREEGSE